MIPLMEKILVKETLVFKYPQLKGREGKPSRTFNRPPNNMAWCWITGELLNSVAWRSMSVNCHKLIDRLLLEHCNNAGLENGSLICTYNHFQEYGLTRNMIRFAIEEAGFLGLVKHQRGERVFAKNQPNSYRLTFYGTKDAKDPTNEWKLVTTERVKAYRKKKKEAKEKRKQFKIKMKQRS